MKAVTLNIPTSIADIKMLLKERTNKRFKHNKEVLDDLYNDIITEMRGSYWKNDLSDYFRKNYDCKDLFNKALKKLQ